MGFLDLFRPKWKHSEFSVRREAVEKLTDQNLLAEIAKSDKDSVVRIIAVEKLTDQNLLAEIAKNDKDFDVRRGAVEKLTDQNLLAEVTRIENTKYSRALREFGNKAMAMSDNEMIASLEALCSCYSNTHISSMSIRSELNKVSQLIGDDFYPKQILEFLERRASVIGERLHERGGLEAMRKVFSQLEGMRGARTLEMHWNGIGDWRG